MANRLCPLGCQSPTILSRALKYGAEMSAGSGFGSGVKSPAIGNQIAGRASHHQLALNLLPGPRKKQKKKQRKSPPGANLPRWTRYSDNRLLFLPDETRTPTPLTTPGLPFPSWASTLDVFHLRHLGFDHPSQHCHCLDILVLEGEIFVPGISQGDIPVLTAATTAPLRLDSHIGLDLNLIFSRPNI